MLSFYSKPSLYIDVDALNFDDCASVCSGSPKCRIKQHKFEGVLHASFRIVDVEDRFGMHTSNSGYQNTNNVNTTLTSKQQ